MSLNLDIDTTDYDLKFASINEGLCDYLPELLLRTTEIIAKEMRNAVPVKTGKLKASIRTDILPNSAEISTNSGYGKFVDEDTEPHIIRAKGKPEGANFLRIPLGEKIIFRKQVFHSGTTGQQFRMKAIRNSISQIDDLFDRDTRDLMN